MFPFRSVGSAGEAKYTEPIPAKAKKKNLILFRFYIFLFSSVRGADRAHWRFCSEKTIKRA